MLELLPHVVPEAPAPSSSCCVSIFALTAVLRVPSSCSALLGGQTQNPAPSVCMFHMLRCGHKTRSRYESLLFLLSTMKNQTGPAQGKLHCFTRRTEAGLTPLCYKPKRVGKFTKLLSTCTALQFCLQACKKSILEAGLPLKTLCTDRNQLGTLGTI